MLRILFSFLSVVFALNSLSAQVVSYGEQQDLSDSIVISRAAPEWISTEFSTLESYLETRLFINPIMNLDIPIMGVNAYLYFTVDKTGGISDVDVNCAETKLILPLIHLLDSMPNWKTGIKNDRNINTKMEYYINIQRSLTGQYVIKQERIPPKLVRSNLPLKITIMAICVTVLLWKIL